MQLHGFLARLVQCVHQLICLMPMRISRALPTLRPVIRDKTAYPSLRVSGRMPPEGIAYQETNLARQASSNCGRQATRRWEEANHDRPVTRKFASQPAFPTIRRIAIGLSFAAVSAASCAQTLSLPSRSVYKCSANGKTTYSDAPCLGGQRLDIEPTRGVGGREGRDVQQERHREMFAEALRPLTGMNAKQLDLHGRRMKLSPEAQHECRVLDAQTPPTERDEAQATGQRREILKVNLLNLRQRQRELRC